MRFGPGWDFLDDQWDALYPGDDAPFTFRSMVPFDACKQVVAWPATGHWHLVAYGLTELSEKVSSNAEQDGWGIELTLRVPRDGDAPPQWAITLLKLCVEHVVATSHPFRAGHFTTLRGRFGPDATLCGATFVDDPSFEPRVGPFGQVSFLQLVGLTEDELETTISARDARVVDALRVSDPWLVTDPRRASVFDGPHAPARAAPPTALQRSVPKRELEVLRLARSFHGQRECHVGADDAVDIVAQIEARLPAGLEFEAISDAAVVGFLPGETSSVTFDEDVVELTLAPPALEVLVAGLRAGVGGAIQLPELEELAFRVVER